MNSYVPRSEQLPSPEASVDEIISYVFAPPFQMPSMESSTGSFQPTLRRSISNIHLRSSENPIKYPNRRGVFLGTLLAEVPPVVVDANWLRNDIKYACRNDRRTTLTNVANEGLVRLFCCQHVIDEVAEHSAEWTAGSEVSRESFLRRWLLEYMPLLRVLQDDQISETLLTTNEIVRIERLRVVDLDDVPSVNLALVLGAFYLSDDKRALRAVYGPDANLWRDGELLDLLRDGGDGGELGEMLQVMTGLIGGLGREEGAGSRSIRDGSMRAKQCTAGLEVGTSRSSTTSSSSAVSGGGGLHVRARDTLFPPIRPPTWSRGISPPSTKCSLVTMSTSGPCRLGRFHAECWSLPLRFLRRVPRPVISSAPTCRGPRWSWSSRRVGEKWFRCRWRGHQDRCRS